MTHHPLSQADGYAEAHPLAVGDTVRVLRAARLPIEDVLGVGVIQRVTTDRDRTALYWVSGFFCAKTDSELRRASAGGR